MLSPVTLASPDASPSGGVTQPEQDARRRSATRTALRTALRAEEAVTAGPAGPTLGPKARESLLASSETTSPDGLTAEERQIVRDLRARDREVRNHEEAHARVGGPYAGAPSYDLQSGPDGRRYAIGGSVPIDVSPVRGDPEATILKMEIVKAAALAPAKPSAADRNIAALADANRLDALAELAAQRRADRDGEPGGRGPLVAAAEALTRMARILSNSATEFGRGMLDQAV